MSGRTVTCFVMTCDGCNREWGSDREYLTATEARGAAWASGWRFPPKVNPSGRRSSFADDVCPDCVPKHRPTTTTHAQTQARTRARLRREESS